MVGGNGLIRGRMRLEGLGALATPLPALSFSVTCQPLMRYIVHLSIGLISVSAARRYIPPSLG